MDQSDTVFVRISPPRAYVRAVGELDFVNAPRLDDQLSAAIAAGCTNFSLDFSDVTFCDASTIGVIVSLDRTLRATNGSLDIVEVSDQVRRVFYVLGLDNMLSPDPTGADGPEENPSIS